MEINSSKQDKPTGRKKTPRLSSKEALQGKATHKYPFPIMVASSDVATKAPQDVQVWKSCNPS